jgi:transposase
VFGRRLLIARVVEQGWPVAHAAKAQGVSRQCAHRWIARWRAEGEAGLVDRSSRPHHSPGRSSAEVEARVVAARVEQRRGQDWLGPELGLPARTVSRILRRHQLPYLCELDPITGAIIRSSKATAVRYERDRPGELVHVDVKKIGKIPDGGGWRLLGREAANQGGSKGRRVGYDYVHSMIDDHSRLAYSEIHDDETALTCAAFLARAGAYFAGHGITRIERVMTDNAFAYRYGAAFLAPSQRWEPGRSSSVHTAPGRTGKWRGSTAPCKPNGPTASPSPATRNAARPLPPGSSSTTLNADTPHCVGNPQPAGCHPPNGRVQLAAGTECFRRSDAPDGHLPYFRRGRTSSSASQVCRVRPPPGDHST